MSRMIIVPSHLTTVYKNIYTRLIKETWGRKTRKLKKKRLHKIKT